jgi:hypothetical protein
MKKIKGVEKHLPKDNQPPYGITYFFIPFCAASRLRDVEQVGFASGVLKSGQIGNQQIVVRVAETS